STCIPATRVTAASNFSCSRQSASHAAMPAAHSLEPFAGSLLGFSKRNAVAALAADLADSFQFCNRACARDCSSKSSTALSFWLREASFPQPHLLILFDKFVSGSARVFGSNSAPSSRFIATGLLKNGESTKAEIPCVL